LSRNLVFVAVDHVLLNGAVMLNQPRQHHVGSAEALDFGEPIPAQHLLEFFMGPCNVQLQILQGFREIRKLKQSESSANCRIIDETMFSFKLFETSFEDGWLPLKSQLPQLCGEQRFRFLR